MLRRMQSPHFADLRPGMVPAHQQYVTTTLDVFVAAYNTEKVRPEEVPKRYEDLLDPRWKDRLGIEATDESWFGTLLAIIGEARGEKLFRDMVAKNGISVRKGHTLLANLVASGEIPLALTVYNYKPAQLKAKGAKIDSIVLEPAIASQHAVAVHARAPHPHAAALLYDFFLSEGQPLLAQMSFVPSNRNVPSPRQHRRQGNRRRRGDPQAGRVAEALRGDLREAGEVTSAELGRIRVAGRARDFGEILPGFASTLGPIWSRSGSASSRVSTRECETSPPAAASMRSCSAAPSGSTPQPSPRARPSKAVVIPCARIITGVAAREHARSCSPSLRERMRPMAEYSGTPSAKMPPWLWTTRCGSPICVRQTQASGCAWTTPPRRRAA